VSDVKLAQFQEAAVRHIVNRIRDGNGSRRMLLADEVGLGKTIVAQGVIQALLKGRRRPLTVIYLCSNAEIAEQNRTKLDPDAAKPIGRVTELALAPHSSGSDLAGHIAQGGHRPRVGASSSVVPAPSHLRIPGRDEGLERVLQMWSTRGELAWQDFPHRSLRRIRALVVGCVPGRAGHRMACLQGRTGVGNCRGQRRRVHIRSSRSGGEDSSQHASRVASRRHAACGPQASEARSGDPRRSAALPGRP
jgi:Type III restriction enzyme, res subunit